MTRGDLMMRGLHLAASAYKCPAAKRRVIVGDAPSPLTPSLIKRRLRYRSHVLWNNSTGLRLITKPAPVWNLLHGEDHHWWLYNNDVYFDDPEAALIYDVMEWFEDANVVVAEDMHEHYDIVYRGDDFDEAVRLKMLRPGRILLEYNGG